MSDSLPPPDLDHISCGPDVLFRVGPVHGDIHTAHSVMGTGPWVLGPNNLPTLGSLGVLTDAMFASCVLVRRPADTWAVSTELTLHRVAALPADGSDLHAESHPLGVDADGGLGGGVVRDASGRVVVSGTQRLRFVPNDRLPGARKDGDVDPGFLERTADQRMLELLDVAPGTTGALELPTVPHLANPVGNLHGGLLAAVSEVAGLRSVQSDEAPLESASISVVFLRPGPISGSVVFRTETLHRGRTLALVQVTALRPDGKACSIATVTCHRPA